MGQLSRVSRALVTVLGLVAGSVFVSTPSVGGGVARTSGPESLAARQAAPDFTVSPGSAAAPSVVVASGNGCVGTSPIVQVWLSRTPEGVGDDFNVFSTSRAPDSSLDQSGTWTVRVGLTPVVPAGQYLFVARCLADAAIGGDGSFSYAPQTFEVLTGIYASWTISPVVAPADEDVVVTARGTGCVGDNALVYVYAVGSGERDFDTGYGAASVSAAANGEWEARVVLGARPPYTFLFHASCTSSSTSFIYRPSPVPVTTIQRIAAGRETAFTG